MQGSAAFLFPAGRIEPESVRPPSTTNDAMSVPGCADERLAAPERGARKLPWGAGGYNSPEAAERFAETPLFIHP